MGNRKHLVDHRIACSMLLQLTLMSIYVSLRSVNDCEFVRGFSLSELTASLLSLELQVLSCNSATGLLIVRELFQSTARQPNSSRQRYA